MGKPKGNKTPGGNKGPGGHKGKKDRPAAALVGVKKAKTKAVASNLKKLNLQNKSKTEKADEAFKAVKEVVMGTAKPVKPAQVKSKDKPKASKAPVDMEAAMEDFAKL